ncbi:hypothetical protein DER44DRAFT_761294 [Fusarium oxysporum]|nr:hypothetical protein DER44DRAFT_761294 [Fusarium oxysporum]
MAIFWTTPKNNIEMALLFLGALFRKIQRPLTVLQSVVASTGIAVYSEEANQCSVWWTGQSSDLRRTTMDFSKSQQRRHPTGLCLKRLALVLANKRGHLLFRKYPEHILICWMLMQKVLLQGCPISPCRGSAYTC